MWSFLTLLVACAAASASVIVPHGHNKNAADVSFLKKQKQVLDLYGGLGHEEHFKDDHYEYNINEHLDKFTDEKYPKEFSKIFNRGLLPRNGIFTLFCSHTRHEAISLFDVFYFAKDFETFIEVAKWVKCHVHPGMFAYAFTLALIHREDTQSFVIPPFYEIFPSLFTPIDTLHQVFDYKMTGIKDGYFTYNNTGYEYNHHKSMFGGLYSSDNRGYGDFRVSYFREDVGLNNYVALAALRNPPWMSATKYNSPWLKRRGEKYYSFLQQLLARYTHERTAHGLTTVEFLKWDKPIKVGYNPRVSYVNGQNLYNRPDNLVPIQFNARPVVRTKNIERRISDVIDFRGLWNEVTNSVLSLTKDNGTEMLGKIIFGTADIPNRSYYQSAYFSALESLAFITTTNSDRSYIGNALTSPLTAARDPVYYSLITRFVLMFFQHFKRTLGPYSHDEVAFDGVEVQNVEVDKFLTYFDLFDYEVTNAVPMEKKTDYIDHKYYARQYRLNHKPYHYNITVQSKEASESIVRVFLGQKHDADMHLLTVDQAKMSFVEIDRFTAKLNSGVNVLERDSKESPFFTSDGEGFRTLYTNLNKAIENGTPFYVSESGHCGIPERLQLPMGWRGGRQVQLAVVVNSYQSAAEKQSSYDVACGGLALDDGRPLGFPFDRSSHDGTFKVKNIFFKDVNIYHREETEVNRPISQTK